jgi:hypothetical protein
VAIKWEQPPEAAFMSLRKGTYAEFALALKSKPGEWAVVDRDFASEESAKNMASNVRRGGVKAMPKGKYEAVSHGTKVWCRYIPEEGAATPEPEESSEPVQDPQDDGSTEPTAQGYAARVRAWATVKGIPVSTHGRLNEHIVRQYEKETGDRRPA